MDPYIGKMLDNRYEILERIGTGGMAVVYKAKCHRLNRLVAVKILKADSSPTPTACLSMTCPAVETPSTSSWS